MRNLLGKRGVWGTSVCMLCCDSDTLFFGMMTSFKDAPFYKSSIGSSSCYWIITFGVVLVTG
jgi:hypothetical protein